MNKLALYSRGESIQRNQIKSALSNSTGKIMVFIIFFLRFPTVLSIILFPNPADIKNFREAALLRQQSSIFPMFSGPVSSTDCSEDTFCG